MKSYYRAILGTNITSIAILLAIMLFAPSFSYGQKNEVFEELSDAFDYGKKADEYVVSTLDLIKKCYQQSTVEDIHYYARRAKNEIDNAKYQTGYAESDASDAEDEADDISCDDAEDEADDAEGNFNIAASRFEDAYNYLRRVEYADNKYDIEYNLRNAKSSIEDGMNYLRFAMNDLNDAVEALNECR